MSRGLRLPTLYPMPRTMNQYWVCYRASLAKCTTGEYMERVRGTLVRKEDRQPYSSVMIEKLVSNLTGKGFLTRSNGRIARPDRIPYSWDGTWDGSPEGFVNYVDKTILKWCWWWPDGLQLAYDLLTVLHGSEAGLGISEIWNRLRMDRNRGTGRYDGGDRHATRTIRETLQIMEYAHWITRDGRNRVVTANGRNRRRGLRVRDTYHQIERTLAKIDPLSTNVFTQSEWIDLTKVFMWRESGGKGRLKPIQKARLRLFTDRYSGTLNPRIEREIERGRHNLAALRSKIMEHDRSIGRRVAAIRSETKLIRILDSLTAGQKQQAKLHLDSSGASLSRQELLTLKHGGPDYSLAPHLAPYRWQSEALRCWVDAKERGVLQVVTGAGKTFLALLAIQRLRARHPELRVTVLVPTKVLMYQWVMDLVRVLGVPPDDIGLRGDGHKDALHGGYRVVVSIINSAILDDQLRRDAEGLPANTLHFLIADECHRYRGQKFRRAFDAPRDFAMGLSATPGDLLQAPADQGTQHSTDPLFSALGPVVYNYTYRQAKADRVVQPFQVSYVGVELSVTERHQYDKYSKVIRTALKKIRQRYAVRLDAMAGPFFARLHTILYGDEKPDPSISKYFQAVRERKELVYGARNRKWAYLDIMFKHGIGNERTDRVIVFDERIENIEKVVAPMDRRKSGRVDLKRREVDKQLVNLLFTSKFRAVMYHSGRSRPLWNETSMDFFRAGIANVMLSVRALVEGVDVPAANVGVIRASSSSVRQRIQTTGRILRRHGSKDTAAQLYVIFVRDTTDERIFHGTDWAEQLGSSQIRWVHWYPPTDLTSPRGRWREGEAPETPQPLKEVTLSQFDVADLTPGDPYPGVYAGREFHVDTRGRPFKGTRRGRRRIINAEIVTAAAMVLQLKRGGKFVVTPENHMIARVDGKVVFLGVLSEDLVFAPRTRSPEGQGDGPPTFDELFGKDSMA